MLPHAGQLARQVCELAVVLLHLYPLGQNERSGLRWPRQPIQFWNPVRRRAHHNRSLPKMQLVIKLPLRFKQGLSSR